MKLKKYLMCPWCHVFHPSVRSTRMYSPSGTGPLTVDSHQEVCFLVWFEGLRDDAVMTGLQLVSLTDLSHVGERGSTDRRVVLEEVQVQRPTVRIGKLQSGVNLGLA